MGLCNVSGLLFPRIVKKTTADYIVQPRALDVSIPIFFSCPSAMLSVTGISARNIGTYRFGGGLTASFLLGAVDFYRKVAITPVVFLCQSVNLVATAQSCCCASCTIIVCCIVSLQSLFSRTLIIVGMFGSRFALLRVVLSSALQHDNHLRTS